MPRDGSTGVIRNRTGWTNACSLPEPQAQYLDRFLKGVFHTNTASKRRRLDRFGRSLKHLVDSLAELVPQNQTVRRQRPPSAQDSFLAGLWVACVC